MELKTPLTGSIKLRELQRDTKKVCGFLSTNAGNFLDVVNGKGEVIYCVTSKDYLRQSLDDKDGERDNAVGNNELFETLIEEVRELGRLIKEAIHN